MGRIGAGVVVLALVTAIAACSSEDDATPPAETGPDAGAPETTPDAKAPGATAPVLDPLGPQFVDLGEVDAEFDLDVPAGTLGFTIEPLGAVVATVTDPNGKVYDQAVVPVGLTADFTRMTRFPGNSESISVPSGTWTVKLTGPAQVKIARQRTTDGKFHGGVVDLFVYIPQGLHAEDYWTGAVPGNVVTAATAAEDPAIKDFLQTYFAQLKRLLDLDRGKVTFTDADAAYLTVPTETVLREAVELGTRSGDKELGGQWS